MPRAFILLVLATSLGAAAIHSATALTARSHPAVGRSAERQPHLVEGVSPAVATFAISTL